MKLQSKYASVRLLEQLSVACECEKAPLQNTSDSWGFFVIAVWKLVPDLGMYLGCVWSAGISLFMSSSWLNTLANQQSYLLDEQMGCHKQKNQSNSGSCFRQCYL